MYSFEMQSLVLAHFKLIKSFVTYYILTFIENRLIVFYVSKLAKVPYIIPS